MINPETALVYTMVLVSAADGNMSDNEIAQIGEIVRTLPAFRGYDRDRLTKEAEACADALAGEEGLEKVLDQIVTALPTRLAETAYAIACDIAAADQHIEQEEVRMLELLRYRLAVDRLAAAAIERAAKARHQTV
jgi:tellurite resistance protein